MNQKKYNKLKEKMNYQITINRANTVDKFKNIGQVKII